jgi:hypothetical protein
MLNLALDLLRCNENSNTWYIFKINLANSVLISSVYRINICRIFQDLTLKWFIWERYLEVNNSFAISNRNILTYVTFSLIYKNHDIRLFLFSFSLVDNYVFNNNTVHLTLHNSKQNLHPSGDVPINFLVLKLFYIFQYTYSFLTSKWCNI